MRAPIFIVCADSEVLAYAEPERALRYVESPDVEAGEYLSVFDADGRRFKLDVVEPTKQRECLWFTSIQLTPVKFVALEDKPSGADDLRQVLTSFLPDLDPNAALSELVGAAVARLQSP